MQPWLNNDHFILLIEHDLNDEMNDEEDLSDIQRWLNKYKTTKTTSSLSSPKFGYLSNFVKKPKLSVATAISKRNIKSALVKKLAASSELPKCREVPSTVTSGSLSTESMSSNTMSK